MGQGSPQLPRALEGVRVLEVAEGIAGPFAGKLFADHGARVVKIERPGIGDRSRTYGPFRDDVVDREASGMFTYLNAGKESVTLDLDSRAGVAILDRLVGDADVLLASGSPTWLRALGATYDDLAEEHPSVVVTTITPFGMSGPLADTPAHDIDFLALGSVATVVGERDREPLAPPLELSGYQAGLSASSASMLALFGGARTGRGQHVDISPLDCLATVHQGSGLMNALAFGKVSRRSGRRRRDAYPFHLMPAADGLMCLIARDGSQWKRFVLDVVGDPVLTEPRYRDRTAMGLEFPDEVDAVLAPWFSARTRNEIFELCRKHHVPFSPVRTIDEVAECEQLAARGFFVDVTPGAGAAAGSPGSSIRMPGAPYLMSETPMRTYGSAPSLGEHTAAVLERAGYETDEIETWRLQGVT